MEDHKPLDDRVFGNIRVQAFQHPLLDFLGGPVIPDEQFAHFRHKRQGLPCDIFEPDAPFAKYMSGSWVYIGAKYHHFGHVMSEMVHRIIPSKLLFPDIHRYLLVTTYDDDSGPGFDSLCRSCQEVLEFCEIDPDDITVINDNTVVEELSICEQGSNFGGHPTPWYLEVLEEFSKRRLDQIYESRTSPERVYVSRSKIAHGGTILGESYLEELLRQEGVSIFHPEEAPLSMQMDVYRKAKQLVFAEGSACHGTELLGRKMLQDVFVLVRRKEASGGMERILEPRAQAVKLCFDTFLLGTIAVHRETRRPHDEFGVSLADIDRIVTFFRDHQIARLDGLDVRQYFNTAEQDLKAYFSYHMQSDTADVDAWRVGEVRLEFEKVRRRFLLGRDHTSPEIALQPAAMDGARNIHEQAWRAHQSEKWFEAVQCWDVYRERFPDSLEGFTLGSVALIEMGRFYEADALLLEAMQRFPDTAEIHSDYALVAHHRRDWRETVARWESFRAQFPEMMIGYSLAATALCELSRYAEAENLLRAGLERHPGDEELLEKYALAAELSGDRSEALRRWAGVTAVNPDNPGASRFSRKHAEMPELPASVLVASYEN